MSGVNIGALSLMDGRDRRRSRGNPANPRSMLDDLVILVRHGRMTHPVRDPSTPGDAGRRNRRRSASARNSGSARHARSRAGSAPGSGIRASAVNGLRLTRSPRKLGRDCAIAGLGVGGARLRVLAGHAPNPNHGLLEPVEHDQAHLQQDLELRDTMFSEVHSSKVSAQSPPCRTNASPRWARAISSLRASTSQEVTIGGRRLRSATAAVERRSLVGVTGLLGRRHRACQLAGCQSVWKVLVTSIHKIPKRYQESRAIFADYARMAHRAKVSYARTAAIASTQKSAFIWKRFAEIGTMRATFARRRHGGFDFGETPCKTFSYSAPARSVR